MPLLFALVAGCTALFGIQGELFPLRPPGETNGGLRTDGYYYYHYEKLPGRWSGDAVNAVVLWDDGTAAFFRLTGETLNEGGFASPSVEFGTLDQALDRIEQDIEGLEGSSEDVAFWGAYRVQGDSITIQYLEQLAERLGAHTVIEYEGVVLSDTTFKLVTPWAPPGASRSEPRNWVYRFRPFPEKPDSENWSMKYRR